MNRPTKHRPNPRPRCLNYIQSEFLRAHIAAEKWDAPLVNSGNSQSINSFQENAAFKIYCVIKRIICTSKAENGVRRIMCIFMHTVSNRKEGPCNETTIVWLHKNYVISLATKQHSSHVPPCFTDKLTPRSTSLLQKLVVDQLLKTYPTLYETLRPKTVGHRYLFFLKKSTHHHHHHHHGSFNAEYIFFLARNHDAYQKFSTTHSCHSLSVVHTHSTVTVSVRKLCS